MNQPRGDLPWELFNFMLGTAVAHSASHPKSWELRLTPDGCVGPKRSELRLEPDGGLEPEKVGILQSIAVSALGHFHVHGQLDRCGAELQARGATSSGRLETWVGSATRKSSSAI